MINKQAPSDDIPSVTTTIQKNKYSSGSNVVLIVEELKTQDMTNQES